MFSGWRDERVRSHSRAFWIQFAPFHLMWIAFVAGVVHLIGVFFYYMALKRGEASETLP